MSAPAQGLKSAAQGLKSPSFEDASKLFSLPLSEAADSLSVCPSVLKKVCYDNGLVSWPHRKFLSGESIEEIEKDAAIEKEENLVELKVSGERIDSLPMSAALSPLPKSKNRYKETDDGRQRFLLELEFIQCLANPTYIHYLAQNRYFEDEAFIGYLKYLQYWQRPEYIKFIMYPHCLFFLELLQNSNYRSAMAHPRNKELAHGQQFYLWKNYRSNRLKHILPN